MVAWRIDDLKQFDQVLKTLFIHMNQLHDRFDFPRDNRRISEESAQLIEYTLE